MRRVVLAIVSTVTGLVLVLSYKTHGSTSLASPAPAVSTRSGTTTASSSNSGTHRTTGTRTVTGDAVNTAYGPVQVAVKVTNGTVTGATAVQYPMGTPLDQQINSYAIPVLNQEVAQAGSANISMVSGATYTSAGYIQSLQSALNKV